MEMKSRYTCFREPESTEVWIGLMDDKINRLWRWIDHSPLDFDVFQKGSEPVRFCLIFKRIWQICQILL